MGEQQVTAAPREEEVVVTPSPARPGRVESQERRALPAGPAALSAANTAAMSGATLVYATGVTGLLVGGGVVAGTGAAALVARQIRQGRSGGTRTAARGRPARLGGRSGSGSGSGRRAGVLAGRAGGRKASSGRGAASRSAGLLGGARRKAATGRAGAGGAAGSGRRAGSGRGGATAGRGSGGGLRRLVAGGRPGRSGGAGSAAGRTGRSGSSRPGAARRAAAATGRRVAGARAGSARAGRAVRQAAARSGSARQAAARARRAVAGQKVAGRRRPVGRVLAGLLAGFAAGGWVAARNGVRKTRSWWRGTGGTGEASGEQGPADSVRTPGGAGQPGAGHPVPEPQPAPVEDAAGGAGAGASQRRTGPLAGGVGVFKFGELAAEMSAAAAAYDPEDMPEVERHLRALPDALGHVANATRVMVMRAHEEWPIHPAVLELLGQVYQLQVQTAEAVREVAPAFRQLHEKDLQRHEAPRRGEEKWNVPGR